MAESQVLQEPKAAPPAVGVQYFSFKPPNKNSSSEMHNAWWEKCYDWWENAYNPVNKRWKLNRKNFAKVAGGIRKRDPNSFSSNEIEALINYPNGYFLRSLFERVDKEHLTEDLAAFALAHPMIQNPETPRESRDREAVVLGIRRVGLDEARVESLSQEILMDKQIFYLPPHD